MDDNVTSGQLDEWLRQLQQGPPDDSLRHRIIAASQARLERLARHMLRGYPALRRWEQTDDVLQNALLRLYRALATATLPSARDYYRLAGTLIRRELISLIRHHFGPLGAGRHHHTDLPANDSTGIVARQAAPESGPSNLEEWTTFHEAIERLPEEQQQLVDLLWYEGLSQEQAAELLGVSTRTIKNRWRDIKLRLRQMLHGKAP